jgi:hypothetical protein
MKITLAFDLYGTLVEPSGMAKHLAHDVGAKATEFADCWREKQLEYSFRRGLMQRDPRASHRLGFSAPTKRFMIHGI